MSKLIQLREEMTAKLSRLGALQVMDTRSEAEETEIDAILARVNDLGPQIDREREIEAAAARQADYTQPVTRASGVLPRGAGANADGNPDRQERARIDLRPAGQRFVESTAFLDYRKKLHGKSENFEVGSFYHRQLPKIAHSEDMGPDELRTLIGTGALPADMILPQQVPGIFRGIEPPLRMRDVLINGTTNSDAITFMRELTFTNAAVEVAQATTTADGAKPESALTFEQATANVVTIAHWVPITRQTMEDAGQLVTYVNQRLLTGLMRREDSQLLNGNGAGANMTGILNTTGVQAADAAHFAGTPVKSAGFDNENLNRIRRGKRLSIVTGQAEPNFVVLHPTKLEEMETSTDAQRDYLIGDPIGGDSPATLWRTLRVVESQNIATTTALVGDGTMAAVWDRMDARIYTTDSHSDFFIRNIFVILAEERLALTVFRPSAFVAVTLL